MISNSLQGLERAVDWLMGGGMVRVPRSDRENAIMVRRDDDDEHGTLEHALVERLRSEAGVRCAPLEFPGCAPGHFLHWEDARVEDLRCSETRASQFRDAPAGEDEDDD